MSIENSLEFDNIRGQMKRFCAFSLGIKRLEECQPSFHRQVIERDMHYMDEALKAVVHIGAMPFSGITDLTAALEGARIGVIMSAQDLVDEIRLIRGIKGMVSYEKSLTEIPHPYLQDLTGTLNVHEKTERFLSMRINDYGEVVDQASPELARIRAQLRRVDHEISEAAMKFVNSHRDSVVDGIVTYRSGRAVILVKAHEKNAFGGFVYGDSASGATSYVEPASLINVNNKKAELIIQEEEEVKRILMECSEEVAKVAHEELANLETAALLDEIFAKAQWGREHDCCAARLNDRRELSIVKARHPLIDPAIVVANTYRLAPPKTTLLITGPNTGGKTVSMKIIGLFTLMTYAGMPVPCEEADIPYFDQVFADIGDDQSVAESLSSFSAHIRKQAEVCRKATGDSLVLLDEVGSGTDPREGESLAIAILNELRGRGCMTVATTHYGRLKAYGKRHDDVLTASVQFDMEKLAPTYRFMEGTTGQSNAFAVAQRYGLPEHIVKYARFLKDQARSQEDTLIETLEAQVAESDRQKDALAQAIAENEALKKQLEKEKAMFEKERDTWRLKAQKEADAYILKAQREADEVLKEMRTNGMKYHEALDLKKKLTVVQEESMPEPVKDDGVFAVGDAVELRSSNQVGEVVEVGKRELTVEFNGRRIRVKPAQIRHSAHVIVKNKPQASVKMTSGSIFSSMPIECNLIGMRADEAKDTFSSYLDQAKLHGLRYFRVIHGDGSGALRKVVHDILKKDRAVKEYRLGQANEGGSGATIVTLK